jgi:hypothetical protein
MRKCHFCHEDIEDAARVCVHCGRDLIPGHTSAPIETVPGADPAATIVVAVALGALGMLTRGFR